MTDSGFAPGIDVPATSLSRLSDHDWNIISNRWSSGVDYYVFKLGRHWRVSESFGKFPLFKTKRAADDAATTLILWESRHRAQERAKG